MQRALILMSLGLGLTACAADNGDEGIFISKNVAPGADCTFMSTQSELYNPHGTFSLFARRGYNLYPQLVSKIISRDDNVEQRTIQMRGARVDLSFADSSLSGISGDGITHFESLFSAPLSPNGGITDAEFELIPTGLASAVASAKGISPTSTEPFKTEVIAKVVVYGDMSGSEVTSQEFQYPVTLCNDCVTTNLGQCPLPAATPITSPTNPCSPYQDGFADCCQQGNTLVCPAVVMP